MRFLLFTTLLTVLGSSHLIHATTTPPTTAAPTRTPPPPCSFADYRLAGLTSDSDLVARIDSPYTYAPYNTTLDYYMYLNACSDVNQRTGHALHAQVFGAFTTGNHPAWDVLGYNNVSETTWQYRLDEDPYDGVQQILTTSGTCHWNNANTPLDTITTITYMCAQTTPQYLSPANATIIDNKCIVDIQVDTPKACVIVQPMMSCKPSIGNRDWDLSLLAGLERYGTGAISSSGAQYGYYMNVCHNVTHYTESNDMNAMIVQYLIGPNAYQATLASITTPPTWSLIDGNPETGIRATWLINNNDHHCMGLHNTTVDFICKRDDSQPLIYVDRDRREFQVEEISPCNTKITYEATNACVLPIPTTPVPTTPVPTTPAPTTATPTTPVPTTAAPTTEAPTTEAPTTAAPTTTAPTTEAPTTAAPTTEAPTTAAPTTPSNTTKAPTTAPMHEGSSSPPLALTVSVGVGAGIIIAVVLYFIIRCYCRNKRVPPRSINQMHARDPLLDD